MMEGGFRAACPLLRVQRQREAIESGARAGFQFEPNVMNGLGRRAGADRAFVDNDFEARRILSADNIVQLHGIDRTREFDREYGMQNRPGPEIENGRDRRHAQQFDIRRVAA